LGFDIHIEYVRTWKRANAMFRNGGADILFPEISGDETQKGMTGTVLFRLPGFVIFTHKKQQKLNYFKELEGKNVAIILGRYYPPEFLEN